MRPIINISSNSILILSNPLLFHLTLNLILNCVAQTIWWFLACIGEQVVTLLVIIIINSCQAWSSLMEWWWWKKYNGDFVCRTGLYNPYSCKKIKKSQVKKYRIHFQVHGLAGSPFHTVFVWARDLFLCHLNFKLVVNLMNGEENTTRRKVACGNNFVGLSLLSTLKRSWFLL